VSRKTRNFWLARRGCTFEIHEKGKSRKQVTKARSSGNGHKDSMWLNCTGNCRRCLINRYKYFCNVPGHISKQRRETIEKRDKANDGCRKQHVCVISQPWKVDCNFITEIVPVDRVNQQMYYSSDMFSRCVHRQSGNEVLECTKRNKYRQQRSPDVI